MPWAKQIPIVAAQRIAQEYGYDQVVIIARKIDVGDVKGGEYVTTYGVNSKHCEVAARIWKALPPQDEQRCAYWLPVNSLELCVMRFSHATTMHGPVICCRQRMDRIVISAEMHGTI